MTRDIKKTILRYSSLILSLLLIATAITFVVSVVGIYRSGAESPFTRESISAQFARIAPLVYVTVAVAAAVTLLGALFEEKGRRIKPLRNEEAALARMTRGLPRELALNDAVGKERRVRKTMKILTLSLLCVGVALSLCYCLVIDPFAAQDLNAEVAGAFLLTLLSLLPALVAAVIYALLAPASIARETAALKAIGATVGGEAHASASDSGRVLLAVRVLLIFVGLLLVVLGILNGGMDAVVQKAIKICTECIGLG